ncbi:MAG: hypothetical protein R6U19_06460 [Bacteroidales bacterium]
MIKSIYILMICSGILLVSCVPEKKLARNFVNNTPNTSFFILSPDIVFKESVKPVKDTAVINPTQRQLDSLAFLESDFIRYIPDSMFFALYLPELRKEFEKLGLNVNFDTLPHDFSRDSAGNAYVFDFAQIQLQEFVDVYYDTETFAGKRYFKEHSLNGLYLNTWVEFQKINGQGNKPMVLFTELSVKDELHGFFHQNQLSGQVKYSYKIDELDLDDVKNWIKKAGQIHARYLYDFLMNQYIKVSMKEKEMKPKYYLHYDRKNDQFVPVDEKRFVPQ